MDSVAEFVEESDYFVVLEERWLGFSGLGEVANKGCGRISTGAIGIKVARLEREVCCVPILSLTRVQIQIEVANKSTTLAFIIPDTEDLDIFMPCNILGFSSRYENR
jgi:hypothetical protein